MEPVGFTAYQAWRQSLAKSGEIHTPEWEQLPIAERDAWEAVEDAVRDAYREDGA